MALRESWSAATAALHAAAHAKGVDASDVASSLPADHLPLPLAFQVRSLPEEADCLEEPLPRRRTASRKICSI